MGNKNKNIQQIISLYVGNEFPEGIRDNFQSWLASDVHADQKDQILERVFEEIRVRRPDARTYDSLRNVKARLGMPAGDSDASRYNPVKTIAVPLRHRPLFKVAAVMIPFLIVAGAAYLALQKPFSQMTAQHPRMIEISVPDNAGADREIVLPDGSKVSLRSGSNISYPENFGDLREVGLSGEALFEVTHLQEASPFVVKTKHLTATVQGTEFIVEAYPDKEHTAVTLRNGKLKVDIPSQGHSGNLEPGDILSYNHLTGEVAMSKILTETEYFKKNPAIEIVDMTLPQIFAHLAKHYGVTIDADGLSASDERFDITLAPGESLEGALSVLREISGGWNYSIDGDNITISR